MFDISQEPRFLLLMLTLFAILSTTTNSFSQIDPSSESEKPTKLVLTSNIRDCRIIIDSDTTDQIIPARFKDIIPGDHIIILVDKYGKTLEENVVFDAGKKNFINLDFDLGDLEIRSNLAVDSLFINNVLTGQTINDTTFAAFSNMAVGSYKIKLIDKYGISLENSTFIIADNKTDFQMDFPLGDLCIDSNPTGIRIIINGKPTDRKTPATFTGLAEGPYNILLGSKNRQAKETIVRANIDNKVNFNLKKSKTWRYILGAATAVTAGTVYLLTRKEENKPGFEEFEWPPNED